MDGSPNRKSNSRIWMCLNGLSGQGEDLGVGAYLDGIGFDPAAVAIMSSCPDFMHEHDGNIDGTELRWEYSSYNGWNRNRRWTREEFRTVVSAFRDHGVKVFLSSMSQAYHPAFETMSDWAKEHDDMLLVHNTGLQGFCSEGLFADMRYYHIASRFADGRLYEDFFAEQVTKTVLDYGFDGYHAADGYKSFILGIMAGGFSTDLLEQFESWAQIKLPDYRNGKRTDVIPPIADWVWKNHREAWIAFWRRRFAEGWGKVGRTLKAAGKEFSINSAWCTDPLESISRYGMDTKALEEAPAESIFFETMDIYSIMGPIAGPASSSREGYVLEGHEFYPGSLMSALLRGTHTPETKIFPMMHVLDQFERFEFLKCGRSYLEKAIIGYQQLYRVRNGCPEPATAGVWYAFGNDISGEDWNFLESANQLARSIRPARIPGPVALWSDSTIENEIRTARDRWSVHRSLYEIAGAGCPIITAADVGEVSRLEGRVMIWANPRSFSDDDQRQVMEVIRDARNTFVLFDEKGEFDAPCEASIVKITDTWSGATFTIAGQQSTLDSAKEWLSEEADLMMSRGLLREFKWLDGTALVSAADEPQPFEYSDSMESHFMTRVPPTRLPMPFMELAAEVCRRISWPLLSEIRVQLGPREGELAGHENSIFYIEDGSGDLYLLAKNLHRYTSYLKLKWSKPVDSSTLLNMVMYHPEPVGRELELVIPSWGITVCKVRLQQKT